MVFVVLLNISLLIGLNDLTLEQLKIERLLDCELLSIREKSRRILFLFLL